MIHSSTQLEMSLKLSSFECLFNWNLYSSLLSAFQYKLESTIIFGLSICTQGEEKTRTLLKHTPVRPFWAISQLFISEFFAQCVVCWCSLPHLSVP